MEIGYAEAEVSSSRGIVIPARLSEGVERSQVVSFLYLLHAVVDELCIGVLFDGLGRGGKNREEQRRKEEKDKLCDGWAQTNAFFY